MTSVAFLVDGDLEKRFLSENCKGYPIRRIGNGDRFPARVIAKQITTHIRLLSNRIQKFVVLLDLEKRRLSASAFASDIRAEIRCAGVATDDIVIVIKDRMVEDWILADAQSVSEYVGGPVDTTNMEGKGDLSKLLRLSNIKYSETTIGCELLKSVVCSRATERSRSLAYLRDHFPGDCWWLAR